MIVNQRHSRDALSFLKATALEQCAVLGIDNLSVPITVGWLWQALSQQGSA